ncbi:sugar phosphate isomerase [Paenibacillus sp. J31TS4]|uniref:sugar phosphate isomerase/epimerase family protein n=1 Tax=Paenibacillus sp. J31TS4 TaxID=2807195 RepID=UPI001B123BBB|nr:sugar phosphate isomerase/epimerase [Paenibacillus sp. J31TS4]GIP37400.1 sugar phosphate isomerase [Paenibacillus sp. J31TS4]
MKNKLAAQLYTVRDEAKADFPGVLREIRAMGYAGVQISGLHGYEPERIAEVLRETGLQAAGMHVSYAELDQELDEVLRQARLFGTVDLVCPFLTDDMRNEAGYRDVRRFLNEVARKVESGGFRVSYHNHAFEFETEVDGRNALDYLLEPVPDNKLLAEIDVYWVKKAGRDPLSYLEPYRGRMPILHLKDMSRDEKQSYAEVGTGVIDFVPILKWGEAYGVDWYAVEQDVCPGNPLDSLRTSLGNLHRMIEQMEA